MSIQPPNANYTTQCGVGDFPRRFVRMFQPRFARLVAMNVKKQTVRQTPKRMPRRGDMLDAREWTGKPYRSKQLHLGVFTIRNVAPITINPEPGTFGVSIDGRELSFADVEYFAKADGFESATEFLTWFRDGYGFPFNGIVTYWL